MPVTINVNNLTLCHKGSNGVSTATIPDFCYTPAPPGPPVPMPYPNVALSSDLIKGTTTISADSGNMCANYGSEFFKSTGDEPGVIGGVLSATFIKEATWLTFSFDVMLEGKPACRLTDKMFHNHMNTVNMAGVIIQPLSTPPNDPKCAPLYEKIFELIWRQRGAPINGKPDGTLGLVHRWQKSATNPGGWSEGDNATHMKTYIEQRQGLKNKLKEWRKNGCDDKDLPPGTEEYASDQLPELGSQKLTPTPITKRFAELAQQITKAAGETASKYGPLVITLIVLSRIIRLAFPPLELSPI